MLDIEQAIEAFSDVVEVWTEPPMPRNWALAKFNLGNCYLRRARGQRADNVEAAIIAFEDVSAQANVDTWPEHWANIQDGLGQAYRARIAGSAAENLEHSIAQFEKALIVRVTLPDKIAQIRSLNNLANAYLHRVQGSAVDNTDRALALYEQAAALLSAEADPNPEVAALVFQNLGLAFRDRRYGDLESDQQKALNSIGLAMAVYQDRHDAVGKASALMNLASVYSAERFRALPTRENDLKLAVDYLRIALDVFDEFKSSELWAHGHVFLGQALLEQATFGRREENLRSAIENFYASLRVWSFGASQFEWARVHQNLGNAHSMLGLTREGIEKYGMALAVFTKDFPVERQRTLKNMALSWFECGDFEHAIAPFQEAIEIGEDLLWYANAPDAKQSEAAEISNLYPNLAYSLLSLGRAEDALVTLERGKTRVLAQSLAISDESLQDVTQEKRTKIQLLRDEVRATEEVFRHTVSEATQEDMAPVLAKLANLRAELAENMQDVRVDLSIREILDLVRPGECFVVPLITARGGAIFVVGPGTIALTQANILWMDSLEVYQMLHPAQPVYEEKAGYGERGWLRWYGVWRSDTSNDTIEARKASFERLLESWWTGLMEPVVRLASKMSARSLVILPQGGLQLFPLHGACRNHENERRYILDDFVTQYAPSAWVLHRCRARAARASSTRQAICFSVKRYQDFLRLRTLPFASTEADILERITGATILCERDATSAAVIEQAPHFTDVHFACHGTLSDDPLNVALQLGGQVANQQLRDALSVRTIIAELQLKHTRLITMAACESGVVEHIHSADEYVGLPGVLLQAGAASVINSLLVVHDLASCLLWSSFYDRYWNLQEEPAAALRAAQLWLRSVKRQEVRAIISSWRKNESEAAESVLAGMNGDRPFAHPSYWVGFVCLGA